MAIKQRGYNRKQRNTGSRNRKSVIFMAAEGKNKTESLYFKAFAQDTGRVIRFAPGNYTDPINLVTGLRDALKDNEFQPELGDKAYCLIDSDFESGKDKKIANADKLAAENGIELIVSSPCFEIWFIVHYVYSTKKYTSNDEILADVQKYIKGYTKGMANTYDITKKHLEAAIQNARRLESACHKAGYKWHTTSYNPSTEVYKIAEEITKQTK